MFSANLPPITPPAIPAPGPSGVETIIPLVTDVADALAPTTKDIGIGLGVLAFVTVLIFLVRHAFVNWLVKEHKRSPNSAGMAGWGLFGCLFFGSSILVLFIISSSLLKIAFIAPLAGLSLASLVFCIIAARKR